MPRWKRWKVPALLLLGAGAACTPDRISGPAPGRLSPEVERALLAAGATDGPALVVEGRSETGEPVYVAGEEEITSLEAQSAQSAFHAHPNGGTRGNLRGKEIFGADPTWPGVFTVFCLVNGVQKTVKAANIDSIVPRNFGSATGGHGGAHSYADVPPGRPLGKYEPNTGPTRNDGSFPTVYTANIASGDEKMVVYYKITDPDSLCNGISDHKEFKGIIRAPGLVPIPQDPNLQLSPPSSDHPGSTFWYLEPGTLRTTQRMAAMYKRQYGSAMVMTAASLAQGGINDINNNWAPSHWEHRVGTDIDVDDQAGNSPTRIREIRRLGQRAGFVVCEGHGPKVNGVTKPNHVHCKQREYR